jgi:UDP-glucose 4-epimerase
MKKKRILITGGCGYIGSCLYTILRKKYDVFVLYKNKKKDWQKIPKKKLFICNILNFKKTEIIITKINPNTIIHLASLSTVNEKFKMKDYYQNNVVATNNILRIMQKNKIRNIIYSSTASVYDYQKTKINETSKLNPISKYGKTKLISENKIKNNDLNYIIFRFFNVTSAIIKPLTGEYHDPETHLIPSLVNNLNNNKISKIFGNDYNTRDGTCIRDYIHIKDICDAIYKGIKLIEKNNIKSILNLGNGKGNSNLDIFKSIMKISKKNMLFKFLPKRKGDQPKLICNIQKSKRVLNWRPRYSSLNNIIRNEIVWSNFLIKKKYNRKFS